MHAHVLLQEVQLLEGVGAQQAGVRAVVHVQRQVVLKRRVRREALVAQVAGEGVGVAPVHPQVLLQLVLVPEGLAAVRALEGPEALPDEEVLQRCILGRVEGRGGDEGERKKKREKFRESVGD